MQQPELLASLHWLSVMVRIDLKINSLTGVAHTSVSAECLSVCVPNRSLRLSSVGLLNVPQIYYKKFGGATFGYYEPKVGNKLPLPSKTRNRW